MRWIIFSKLKILKVNLIIFLIFSLVVSFVAEKLPAGLYSYHNWLYKVRKWEKNGAFYEKIFIVKKWKCRLPEISDFVKSRFAKKHLKNNSRDYLYRFVTESCKAEFTHWIIILSSLLFFFWNDAVSALLVVFIAVLLNLPYIIIQRYNRPRLLRLLKKSGIHPIDLESAGAHA